MPPSVLNTRCPVLVTLSESLGCIDICEFHACCEFPPTWCEVTSDPELIKVVAGLFGAFTPLVQMFMPFEEVSFSAPLLN